MTGRRLYDLFADAWQSQATHYERRDESTTLIKPTPVAWPFLTPAERRVFNEMARRLTPKRRTT